MTPYVRVHYPDHDNRVKVEVQWASADLMKIAHEANYYQGTRIPYAMFWFDDESDDLIAFLEVFPPHEIRRNPLREIARLNNIPDDGSNDDLIARLQSMWSASMNETHSEAA